MLVKCGVCGGHVPSEVAVDLPSAGGARYCSLHCAMEADPKAAVSALPELPRRILVAADGSGPSLRATQMAALLARQSGAELTPRGRRWGASHSACSGRPAPRCS